MKNNRFFPKLSAVSELPKHDRTAWLRGGEAICKLPPRKPLGKAWRIVLLGAPGIGKGTQAELLSQRLGACHLSTGDVFRSAKCIQENELTFSMRSAIRFMQQGALVPDETVLNLVCERTRCFNCSGGFLLDGFPRTIAQAVALDEILAREQVKLSVVFNYELPIETIVARISGRRTCANCKAVYHMANRPSLIPGVCDHCGGKLAQREDDHPESVKVRMKAYTENTRPLIEYYQRQNLLVNVLANGTPEEIYQRSRLLALTV